MLNYTGHPLVDVGVATITAFAEKDDPTELTEADLEKVVEYLINKYLQPTLTSFLSIAFTINAGFTQPGFKKTPEKRQIYAKKILGSYSSGTPTLTEKCVFTGKPAVAVSFDVEDRLPLGRAFRQHIPLLTGEGQINFHPYGVAGLPVSGEAILAVQAFPLGCARRGGRLLAVHSDNQEIMLEFARGFLQENREAIQLAGIDEDSAVQPASYSYRTLLIDTLLQAKVMQGKAKRTKAPFSITAYYLTNSGQKPDLDIYYLPLQMTEFFKDMVSPDYRGEWFAMVNRSWEQPPKKKKDVKNFKPRRNWLYEDLMDLTKSTDAAQFIQRRFLRPTLRYVREMNVVSPNAQSNNEAYLASWKIVAKFLERIMHMEKERTNKIRELADRLAQYVAKGDSKGKRFFNEFRNSNYTQFRNNLLRVLNQEAKQGNLIFGMDDYITIFEFAEDASYTDWSLARDLVYIRMIEQLHQTKWAGFKSEDVLPEIQDEETEGS